MYLVLFFTNLHRTNVLKIIIYQFFIYSVRLVKLFFVAATEESPHSWLISRHEKRVGFSIVTDTRLPIISWIVLYRI